MYVTIGNDINGGRQAFEKAISRGKRSKLFGLLTGNTRSLESIQRIQRAGRFAGLQQAPIDRIRGTLGRENDFDIEFNPLRNADKERWMGVYNAWLCGASLPPVELVKVGDIYYVRDGHHRISVARSFGATTIEAYVTVKD